MAEIKECVIVSGSPENDLDFIKNNIPLGAFIIAADSGYKKLEKIGVLPDIIVADFDSSEMPDYNVKCEVFPVEKDATDTFNAVKLAIDRGYNKISILGALGGRLDHTYSNILCLAYANSHNCLCALSDRNNRISLINEKGIINNDYKWFSIFAFLGDCRKIKIDGAHYTQSFYNMDSFDLRMSDQFGQSNFVEKEECVITLESGTLLLIESNDYV